MIKYFIILFVVGMLSLNSVFATVVDKTHEENASIQNKASFVAYIRVKNAINTLEACLNSIQDAFDRIVIIYSNEEDDGSKEFIKKWCVPSRSCEHHEYPYFVIPSHDSRYKNHPKPENTLAAYYNFGLSFFDPEEFVVKIDADQIYFPDRLKEIFEQIRQKTAENDMKQFGIVGYNTFIFHNRLVNHRIKINGGVGAFIVKRKYMTHFIQKPYYEALRTQKGMTYSQFFSPVWFHFMTNLRQSGHIKKADEAGPDEYSELDEKQQELFIKNVLPYLKKSNSVYQNLKLSNDEVLDKPGV